MNFNEWIRFFLLGDDSSDLLGKYGEDLTARKLKWTNFFGFSGLMLRNVYIPAEIGETTEIDLIYITKKGLFIIESKNCSGWIFGRESDRYWTQCLPDHSRFRFFNPIWQNRGHIKWLRSFLRDDALPCFSLIVFSERCSLKKLEYNDESCVIVHRDELISTMRAMWKKLPDMFDETGVQSIYDTLSILQNADEALKQAHIDRIQTQYCKPAVQPPAETATPVQFNSPDVPVPEPVAELAAESGMKCPRCGNELVLRVSQKGANAGEQFYGCSAFPKCRFIRMPETADAEPVAEPVTEPIPEPVTENAAEVLPEQTKDTVMKCPRCGAVLVLRTAKKGGNAGKQFYGCSAFPKCRYMMQIPETEDANGNQHQEQTQTDISE